MDVAELKYLTEEIDRFSLSTQPNDELFAASADLFVICVWLRADLFEPHRTLEEVDEFSRKILANF